MLTKDQKSQNSKIRPTNACWLEKESQYCPFTSGRFSFSQKSLKCEVKLSVDAFEPIPFAVESTCPFHLFILYYYCQRTHQSSLGFDKRPVLSVHLVVEAAGVTEVVAVPIPPPQRGRGCSTVHTLTTLCKFNWSSILPPAALHNVFVRSHVSINVPQLASAKKLSSKVYFVEETPLKSKYHFIIFEFYFCLCTVSDFWVTKSPVSRYYTAVGRWSSMLIVDDNIFNHQIS